MMMGRIDVAESMSAGGGEVKERRGSWLAETRCGKGGQEQT